jgi:tripartite-type tricarboxylate transporter receptor subunit TctC
MLRVLQKALALTALALACIGAHAQTYPSKPVTLIVPFAAGGANDTVARPYAQKMSQNLGQQFVVDNRPGAGGATSARSLRPKLRRTAIP